MNNKGTYIESDFKPHMLGVSPFQSRPIEKNKIVIGEIGEMRKPFAVNAAAFKKGARVIDPAAHLFDEAHFFAHGNGRKNKESVLNNEEE